MATAPRFWRQNPSRYNMVGIRCDSCGRNFFPPRAICPVCHRKSVGKMVPVKFKGEGKVYSFTEVHEGLDERTGHRLRPVRHPDRHQGEDRAQEAERGGPGRGHPLRLQVRPGEGEVGAASLRYGKAD